MTNTPASIARRVSTGKFVDDTTSLSAIISLTILPVRSEVIKDAKMLNFMRNAAAMLVVLLIAETTFCAAAQPPVQPMTPQMSKLVEAHRAVIHGINTPGEGGRLRQLDEAALSTDVVLRGRYKRLRPESTASC